VSFVEPFKRKCELVLFLLMAKAMDRTFLKKRDEHKSVCTNAELSVSKWKG
jgi:hypothetical protein